MVHFTINYQLSEKEEGAMLWYSKACFRVRKHGTHHPKLVIISETDHFARRGTCTHPRVRSRARAVRRPRLEFPRFLIAAHLGRPWHTLLVAVYKSALRFGEISIGEKWGKIGGG